MTTTTIPRQLDFMHIVETDKYLIQWAAVLVAEIKHTEIVSSEIPTHIAANEDALYIWLSTCIPDSIRQTAHSEIQVKLMTENGYFVKDVVIPLLLTEEEIQQIKEKNQ